MWVPFMLFWGYLFSTLAGDLSTLTAAHWIALVALVLAMMGAAGTAATRVKGSGKRKEAAAPHTEWRANNLTLATAPVRTHDRQDRERLADRYEGAYTRGQKS